MQDSHKLHVLAYTMFIFSDERSMGWGFSKGDFEDLMIF